MPQGNSFGIKLLSVVIPAYKQEKTILEDVKNIKNTLDILGCKYELIIVVDGVVDNTYKKVHQLKSEKVKILSYPKNQGKGYAVKYGMLRAKGDVIGFIDAGMDIHPNGFAILLNHMTWYNADIIIGSKMHPASKVNYPLYRKILSFCYRMYIATLFGFKVRDTQVGIKFFKRKVVEKVIPHLLVKNYAFDIEVLAVAYRYGFTRIFEAPVEINFNNASSITSLNLWRVILYMVWDSFIVFYRVRIMKYYDKKNIEKRETEEKQVEFAFPLSK